MYYGSGPIEETTGSVRTAYGMAWGQGLPRQQEDTLLVFRGISVLVDFYTMILISLNAFRVVSVVIARCTFLPLERTEPQMGKLTNR